MSNRSRSTNRHVVVTGASKGIGEQIAREYARRGDRVTLVARSEDRLKALADEIGAIPMPADLTDPDQRDGLVRRMESEGGPIDVMIHNAALAVVARIEDQSADDVLTSLALNVAAPIDLTRQVMPSMLDRDRGQLTFVSSLAGITAFPWLSTYGATKAALVHFAASLQRELRRTNVQPTIVQLGEVSGTDMMEDARRSPTIAAVSERLGRIKALPDLTTQDVARAVVDAGDAGRRHAVVPKRVTPFHLIRELPSRMNDLILLGIE